MNNQITLTYAELRALLVPVIPHAGTDDMLPVLKCIQVTTEQGWVVAQATDRFTVGFRRVRPATAPPDGFAMLLQASDAKRLVRLLRPSRVASSTGDTGELAFTGDTGELAFTLSGTRNVLVSARSAGFAMGFASIDLELLLCDGKFPDLLGMLPSAEDLEEAVPAARFSTELLARFAPALDVCDTDVARSDRGLLMRMPGRPMWVTVGEDADFLGGVMPRSRGLSKDAITPAVIESWRPVKAAVKPKAAAKAGASS